MWRSIRCLAPVCLMLGVGTVDPPGRRAGPGREQPAADSVPDQAPGGGAPAAYQGEHRREIRLLLERARGWRTSRDARTDAGVPPPVPIACMRDAYVAAAVQHAWAAESYYRLRHPRAEAMAAAVRDDLDRADELCAVTGRGGEKGCATLRLWGCPARP